MIAAAILPRCIDDRTVDEIVTTALKSGLVACNAKTGPFRVSFFKPDRIPSGLSKIGFGIKDDTPCAA